MKKATDKRHVFSVRTSRGQDASILRLHIECVANALSVYIDRKSEVFNFAVAFFDRAFLVAKRADDSANAGNAEADCQHSLLYHKNPPPFLMTAKSLYHNSDGNV